MKTQPPRISFVLTKQEFSGLIKSGSFFFYFSIAALLATVLGKSLSQKKQGNLKALVHIYKHLQRKQASTRVSAAELSNHPWKGTPLALPARCSSKRTSWDIGWCVLEQTVLPHDLFNPSGN